MLSVLARPWLFSLVVALALLAPERTYSDDRFERHRPVDRIVVFGDSLSDPGNAFALLGGQTVAPPTYGMDGLVNGIPEALTLIPDAPYESRRFSNGVTWIELLAGAIGLGSSVKPAVPGALIGSDDGRASNYAVGGATAGDVGVSQFHLGAQVDLFLSDVRYGAPSDALYVIAIGGNDVRAALAVQDPIAVFNAAWTAIGENVGKLYQAGARKFLVWNAPDLGRAPAIRRLDAAVCPPAAPGCIANGATQASAGYNAGLAVVLQQAGALPGIDIVPFDTFGSLAAIQAHPRRYGLRDATNACIQPDVPQFGFPNAPPFRCAQPDRHLFWDGIHPTRAGHAIIAFLVAKRLVAAVL